MRLTSSPGLFLGCALDCRLAVWDGRRALVFRSHRRGWVALTTRGVQRLPLMARILLCLANAAASAFAAHGPSLSFPASALWRPRLPRFQSMCVCRGRNAERDYPRSSKHKGGGSPCVSSPAFYAQGHAVTRMRGHSGGLPLFSSNFCVIFVSRTLTPRDVRSQNRSHSAITAFDCVFTANRRSVHLAGQTTQTMAPRMVEV